VDQSSRDLFPRTQEECLSDFLDILSRSGDIRNQSGRCKKSTEILHVLAPIFFRGETPNSPNFWTLSGHCSQIPIMWQSLAAIGRGTSEIWLAKKHHG